MDLQATVPAVADARRTMVAKQCPLPFLITMFISRLGYKHSKNGEGNSNIKDFSLPLDFLGPLQNKRFRFD